MSACGEKQKSPISSMIKVRRLGPKPLTLPVLQELVDLRHGWSTLLFSSAECCLRVALRISLTRRSDGVLGVVDFLSHANSSGVPAAPSSMAMALRPVWRLGLSRP